MQAKLAEAKRGSARSQREKKAADIQARAQLGKIDPKLNTDAFASSISFREKVEMAEAEADALKELAVDGQPADECLADDKNSDQLELDAELAELKRKLAK